MRNRERESASNKERKARFCYAERERIDKEIKKKR